MPLSYFEGHRSGEVVSRIADIHAINELVSQIVLGLPSEFFIAVVSLGFMLFLSWQLTLASILSIVTACQIAGADEFISELPDKYHTVLGEFGANLSGGQRQRLAIARAIITNPPILILDESTGALDPSNEVEVLNRLLTHRQGKTTILISHRPRVIGRADWIVLLEKGRLQIQGSPKELRQIAGDHLDFLDDVWSSTPSLMLKSSGSPANGKYATIS